ncbi:MAG TPA: hypothetical protein VKY22_12580 [Bradyrhizobium sp.]|nr:hypothetical protein [Bradyrhizobium sp.]
MPGERKGTRAVIRLNEEFVVNLVLYQLAGGMRITHPRARDAQSAVKPPGQAA